MATENDVKIPEPAVNSRDVVEAAFDAYDKAPDAGLITLEKKDVAKGEAEEPTDATEADKAALGGEKDRAVEVPEEEEAAAERQRDPETGQFVKGAKPPAKIPTIRKGGPAAPATPQAQAEAVPPPAPVAPASSRTSRAPQSWRPAAREGFEKLPPAAREEIWRLEGEREKVVRETAPLRRFSEDWQRTMGPYEQVIRASGVEPLQAVGNVMRTVYALGTQPEQVRARILHGIMKTYGVSVETLANVIDEAGGAAPAGGQAPQPQATYDPRFDSFIAEYRQEREATQAQANAAADAELAEFANDHEFLDDVLPEMLDFMDVAAKRGLAMDYETSYSRALALRPDLMEILQQREAAAASPEGPTQRAIQASSSVRGSPSRRPAPGQKFADSREAAAAAYDQHAGDGGRV